MFEDYNDDLAAGFSQEGQVPVHASEFVREVDIEFEAELNNRFHDLHFLVTCGSVNSFRKLLKRDRCR